MLLIQENHYFYYLDVFLYMSRIISLQSFAKPRIVLAKMLVRNDEAKKVQMFNKLSFLLSDQVKESINGIIIQSTFLMYKMTRNYGFCYANDSVKGGKVSPKLAVIYN